MIQKRTTNRGTRYDVRLRDPSGRTYNRTFSTRKEAERWERAELGARDRGDWVDPKARRQLFGEVAKVWEVSNPGKRPSSIARDEIALRRHVLPMFGTRHMQSIVPADVQGAVNAWSKTMAPRSVKRTYGVLRAVLAMAVERDIITRTPCRGIKLPEAPEVERDLPSGALLADVAEGVGPDYEAMVWLGAVLGMRWGEVAGLRVGRVDFLRSRITVAEQVTRGPRGVVGFGAPKTAAGRRTLAMPASLGALLSDHLARRGLTGADGEALVFVAPEGGTLDYTKWRRRVWQPACRGARVPGLGFHDLRRLNATALVAEGVDVKTAQVRLGHSDPAVTLGIYAQATDDADRSAAELVADRLMPRATG